MIFTDRTIIVQKGTSSINDTIILYRGDKGVEIRFTLNEGSPFRFGSGASPNIIEKTEAAYGQLIIKRPNDLPAIFSEIVPTNGGKIIFTITAEMIDEITEVGNYTFQIRLLDESMNSRATLPEVNNGIEIREPIATEDITTTNEVGIATVGYAMTTAGTTEDAFDSQGNYNKTTWVTGDRITDAKLNKIEAGIDGVNQKVASSGTGSNNAGDISIADTGNYFTSTNVEGALQEAGSQINNIENYSLVKHTDGLLYIKKADGTLIGTGVEVGSDVDLSTLSMSISGQTLTLKNGTTTLSTVTIPTAVITDEQLSTIIENKIADGSLSALTIEDGSIEDVKLAPSVNKSIGIKVRDEIGKNGYSNTFNIDGYKWLFNTNINNSGTIITSTTFSKKIAMEQYINCNDLLNEYSEFKDENGELYLHIISDSDKYGFIIHKLDSKGSHSMYPYGEMCYQKEFAFRIDTDGSSFNICIQGTNNITDLKDVFKHIKFYLKREEKEIEYNPPCLCKTYFNSYIFNDHTSNCAFMKIVPHEFYYFKMKGISELLKNKTIKVDISLFNSKKEQIYNQSATIQKVVNGQYYWGSSFQDNRPDGAFVGMLKVENEDAKYLLFSINRNDYGIDIKDVEITKGSIKNTFEDDYKYLFDNVERIKQINPKYKNFKGAYDRNLDGIGCVYSDAYYPSSPYNMNDVFKRNDYYNGNKGDFYFYFYDTPKVIGKTIAQKGDIIYFDGTYLFAEKNPLWRLNDTLNFETKKYDVCIIGGGSGGLGASYALKDKGLNVCLIEKLDTLGGTNTNSSCPQQIASPIASWYKEITKKAMIDNGAKFIRSTGKVLEYGEDNEDSFEKKWRASMGNKSKSGSDYGNHVLINPWWFYDFYDKDLGQTIDIKYNREVIGCKEKDGKIISVTVKNLVTGGEEIVYADYFIDSTANINLLRCNGVEGTDYFIGTDTKEMYNENAIKEGTVADRYDINTIELGYYFRGSDPVASDFIDFNYTEDMSEFPTLSEVTSGSYNNVEAIPTMLPNLTNMSSSTPYDKFISLVSPTKYVGIKSSDYIDYGEDYTYMSAIKNAKAHYKLYKGSSTDKYFVSPLKMLGFRESYRAKCDYMLTQTDIENTVTLDNYKENKIIALSSWYADSHQSNATINFDSINNTFKNGIPYESLVVSKYTNVLVACRGLGASHIASSCFRLIRTMMSIGYASGIALYDVIKNNRGDVRNADIPTIQTACEIEQLITDRDKYIFTYKVTKTLTNCTISNTLNVIPYNATYTANITASNGYTLNTVTVTMGGTDITSTSVSDGVILIENVIGDVSITAVAS